MSHTGASKKGGTQWSEGPGEGPAGENPCRGTAGCSSFRQYYHILMLFCQWQVQGRGPGVSGWHLRWHCCRLRKSGRWVELWRPFRAFALGGFVDPERCPGLSYFALTGLVSDFGFLEAGRGAGGHGGLVPDFVFREAGGGAGGDAGLVLDLGFREAA